MGFRVTLGRIRPLKGDFSLWCPAAWRMTSTFWAKICSHNTLHSSESVRVPLHKHARQPESLIRVEVQLRHCFLGSERLTQP